MIHWQQHIGRTALALASVGVLALGSAGFAVAQDATAASSPSSISAVGMVNPDGLQIGTVIGSEYDGAVTLIITASNLVAGEHGMHIHETGTCDPEGEEPFSSAGGHFNPAGTTHGPGMATVEVQVQEPEEGAATPAAEGATPMTSADAGTESHAGDLGNVTVDETGRISVSVTTTSVTFATGVDTSLADADGSALVIHENADDLATDPTGESGGRIACAVLFAPTSGTPAASPEA